MTARVWNEPVAAQVAAEEGLRIAYGIGDSFVSRQLRYVLGWAQILRGDLTGAAARLARWPRSRSRPTTWCSRWPRR